MLDTIIGYLAAFCTTAAFIPQAYKVYRTKKTEDISLGMFLLMCTGVASWLLYGLLIQSPPIISANSITLVFALYIFFMKIKLDYKKRKLL